MLRAGGKQPLWTDEAAFEKMNREENLGKEFDEVRAVYKSLEPRFLDFAYIPFQAYVGMKTVLDNKLTTVVQLSTGVVKSFIAAQYQ